ncbi:DNA/RNA polymerases superfamily protein [Gossypium australe]|uniref:DNA/RNA polymerases superfamily protein n=1 Tax=Gossypium australe TaxID=47621 RepID=A0A5B6VKC2_9ROSI|nr:DNA/RNA polymerases superfamily protein [Gossypium australe]
MVPEWKWDQVTMDFVTGLLLTPSKKDVVLVIIDRLTKSSHFIPVLVDYSLDKLANLYISEIVRLHGVPLLIISDRDMRFTSRFWKNFSPPNRWLVGEVDPNSRRHAQGSWEKYLPFVEFAYNNSFQSSLKMAPYEALYGQRLYIGLNSERNRYMGSIWLKKLKRKKEIEFKVGDKVFLKVSPWRKVLIFGRKGKLSPRFIGPYEVTERIGLVVYRLALPPKLERIHGVFHIQPDLTYGEDPVRILAHEVKQLRNKSIALVKVLWQRHGIEEAT